MHAGFTTGQLLAASQALPGSMAQSELDSALDAAVGQATGAMFDSLSAAEAAAAEDTAMGRRQMLEWAVTSSGDSADESAE